MSSNNLKCSHKNPKIEKKSASSITSTTTLMNVESVQDFAHSIDGLF